MYSVSYKDMIRDPLASMKDIYSNFGWEMTREAEDNLKSHIQENRQNKSGKHSYSLTDFGITENDLKEAMTEYVGYFGVNENIL